MSVRKYGWKCPDCGQSISSGIVELLEAKKEEHRTKHGRRPTETEFRAMLREIAPDQYDFMLAAKHPSFSLPRIVEQQAIYLFLEMADGKTPPPEVVKELAHQLRWMYQGDGWDFTPEPKVVSQ